jgi:muconolactone D-isomerase
VEFLVCIEVGLPLDMAEDRRRQLLEAESARGRELIAAGSLLRIWRVPGRRANVSLYRAADATELHALLASLPLFPWLDISVEALATHPLEG